MQFFYLHGFASGPESSKARLFHRRFAQRGVQLHVPDLNKPGFESLTFTRQLQQVESLMRTDEPTTLIGSSLGGLTAVWLAERISSVERLLLLAPAFGFPDCWYATFEYNGMHEWKSNRYRNIFHYGDQEDKKLLYDFVEDFASYARATEACQRSVPTLILHGLHDDVIPVANSEQFALSRSHVTLMTLESDHLLTDLSNDAIQTCMKFCLARDAHII